MKKLLPLILILVFSCQTAKENKIESQPTLQEEAIPKGQALLESSDCQTCHHAKNNLIGPSYTAVAMRYQQMDTAAQYLAGKIIAGGSGNWGDVSMLPHPDITNEDALEIARYIMSFQQK
ncbi:MAG: cytochrome c class I [Cyclobacteriaceae bacterium]|nr:cytochrome c class I [Flammeovirgaceae bacterium]MCZ8023537.1 cytochrome c class I [Cytophagales bacterium]MCZ8327672.1 cytochrome c class I [Cyclobacteriaceae bacterium]